MVLNFNIKLYIMNKKIIATLFLLVSVLTVGLAQDFTLKGIVKSTKTQKGLKGVNISIPSLKKGTTTDANGKFTISLPEGKYKMQISCIGYETKVKRFNTNHKNNIVITLDELITNLDEVSITGTQTKQVAQTTTKLNVPLKDIPMTVSSLDKKMIEELQVTSINDAMRYTTGVKPVINYGGFQTFKLRGLGKPVVMLDGARDDRMVISNSAPMTSLAAVERIEYLKGPASVTHGNSVDGGIINVIRKQPTNKFTANMSAYYGSWNNKGIIAGVGGKLTNKMNYRIDAHYGDKDGWRDVAEETKNAYIALDYNMDTNNKFELRFGGNKDFYGTETGFPVIGATIYDMSGKAIYQKGDLVKGFDRSQRYNDPHDFLKHENANASLKYIHSFSDKSKLNYYASFSYDYIDYFSTEYLRFATPKNATDNKYYSEKKGVKTFIDLDHIVRDYPLRFSHRTRVFQNNLDYTTAFNTGAIKHNFLAGYSFSIIDRVSFTGYGDDDIFGKAKYATIAVVNPKLDQGFLGEKFSKAHPYLYHTHGLYAQDLVEFSQKFKALLAVRYDYYKMGKQSATIKSGKRFQNSTPKQRIVNKALTYRFGLVYEPIKELSLYASYSSFYRPNRSTYSDKVIYLNKDGNEFFPTKDKEIFAPENGYQGEFGLRYDVNEKFQLNASAYYINKENVVQYLGKKDVAGVTKKIKGQAGQITSKGFEIDFNYRPIKGLSFTGGYTYCDAKYKHFKNKKKDYAGNLLAQNPKNQFFLWSFYEVQKGLLKNFNLGFGINYTDLIFSNATNSYELPSYWLTDATIGYKLKNNIYFKLKVNNILDTEYFSNTVFSNQFIPGQERNFLFTVGYKL